jgi:hypothetical protein
MMQALPAASRCCADPINLPATIERAACAVSKAVSCSLAPRGEGFLRLRDVPIGRTSWQSYLAHELSGLFDAGGRRHDPRDGATLVRCSTR